MMMMMMMIIIIMIIIIINNICGGRSPWLHLKGLETKLTLR